MVSDLLIREAVPDGPKCVEVWSDVKQDMVEDWVRRIPGVLWTDRMYFKCIRAYIDPRYDMQVVVDEISAKMGEIGES